TRPPLVKPPESVASRESRITLSRAIMWCIRLRTQASWLGESWETGLPSSDTRERADGPRALPRLAAGLRQHGQYRLHHDRGLIIRSLITGGVNEVADDTDGIDNILSTILVRPGLQDSLSIVLAAAGGAGGKKSAREVVLIKRFPSRPSRLNAMSIPRVLRNAWDLRNRPANARGFFGQSAVLLVRWSLPTAVAPSRSDAVPTHLVRLAIILRTQAATGSA